GAAPTLLVHASDDLAREWAVSPDGRTLAYLAPEPQGERIVQRVHVIDLTGGSKPGDELNGARGPVSFVGAIWRPASDGFTVGREAAPAVRAGVATFPIQG